MLKLLAIVGSSSGLPPFALKYDWFGLVLGSAVMSPLIARLALIWSMRGRASTRARPTRRSVLSVKPNTRFALGSQRVYLVPPDTGTSVTTEEPVVLVPAATRWPCEDSLVCATCTQLLPTTGTLPSEVSRLNCTNGVVSSSRTFQFGGTPIEESAVGNRS